MPKDLEEAVELDDTEIFEQEISEVMPELESGKSNLTKGKPAVNQVLKVRRSIEDYFDKKRQHQELDYLLEEDKK